MDEARKIRFLVSPFYFLGSLLLGAHLAGMDLKNLVGESSGNLNRILGILSVAAGSLMPLGFLIGAITVCLLRLIARLFGCQTYEACLSDAAMNNIWPKLATSASRVPTQDFFAVVTFDHELLKKELHDWVVRRWNAFNISAQSCVAVVMAFFTGLSFGISFSFSWFMLTGLLALLFAVVSRNAWRDTMRMLEFQSYR